LVIFEVLGSFFAPQDEAGQGRTHQRYTSCVQNFPVVGEWAKKTQYLKLRMGLLAIPPLFQRLGDAWNFQFLFSLHRGYAVRNAQ